ncbi:APC family permease [Paenarthrobacter sp. DKR-5]|uniref:APC family permease n=1 Tax=Paenarthrobacter sp. DKR-5 TaxID=2835535 RepID=UPI001BDD5877|nr:APC family permease [Paenarthrobacter sp. DKR-5]MBT1004362.1 APC family permease [Paenarthrobacter sp. DKR-5]
MIGQPSVASATRSQADDATLNRTLGLGSVVLFGVAYMAPLIVLGTFGIIAVASGGAVPAAYLLALVAMLFTAQSYGRMAKAFPVSGSAYTYVRRTIDSRAGFLVGWASMLDYFFLPMVIWLIGASFLQAQFPSVPIWVWILGFIVATTVLNVLGIVVAERATLLLMAFQVLVIVIFVALSIGSILSRQGGGGLFSVTPFANPATNLSLISAGAAIAAYSFLGFDAVTTLAEETKNPSRTLPKAIMLVALIGGAVFVVISYVTQLVHPGSTFNDPDSAAFEIAGQIGGSLFSAVFLAGLVVTQFASGIAAQSSAARLLYAMGRDGVLPRRFFGFVHEKYRTPALNILLTAAVGLIALFLDVSTSTSFINFGAFIAFTMVNVSTIAHFLRQRRAGERLPLLGYVVLPALGALVCGYLLVSLDSNAVMLGVAWLVLGVLYLAFLTRGFRKAPPEMHLDEAHA